MDEHGDQVLSLPAGFKDLGKTENTPLAIIGDEKRKFYGVQFHPEVSHAPKGQEIIKNFLLKLQGVREPGPRAILLRRKLKL